MAIHSHVIRSRRVALTTALTVTLAVALAGCASTSAPPRAASSAERVGVFDSRGVALAYGRSARPDCMLAKVQELRIAHTQAKASGDSVRADELEAQAIAIQEKIHRQVFSAEPIDEILAILGPDLAAIAKQAGVDVIIARPLYRDPGFHGVDITEAMCEPFEPDATTRKMIADIITKPVVPASSLSKDY